MPEPDFDQIARRFINERVIYPPSAHEAVLKDFAEQLRQAWDARGAADLKAINGVDYMADDPDASFDAAIRKLDR